jgi:hypothetical protein
MRVTHRHRETRKSRVLNIPSYHVVRPEVNITELMVQEIAKAHEKLLQYIGESLFKEASCK